MSRKCVVGLTVLAPLLLCAAVGQSQQAASADADFGAAMGNYNAGNFAEAAQQLEKLLPRAAKSFELHELLGLAYGAQAQDAKAVEQLEIAVRLKPESAVARTNLAAGLAREGKSAEAEEQAQRALQLDPHGYTANHDLAEFYIQSNKIAQSVPLLEEAQRVRPAAYDNGYDLALACLLTERLDEARRLAESLEKQNDTAELHNLIGRIDEKQGKFIEAASEFSTAAHKDPSEENLFAWASELLLHRAFVPAIEVFREASGRYPQSPRLLIGLGMALFSHGEFEESIHALLNAADLNPKDPRCYLFLSKAYLLSPNQAQDVIDRFKRYADLEPANALAQYYYAVSLWKGKRMEDPNVDYQTVESLLRKSIALDGSIADAHLQLGILYNDQREYAKALPEYERALQLNQNLPDAHYRLGQYYVHAGDRTRAQAEFDRFKSLQAQHQAAIDKERAEVQQFVVSSNKP